MYYTCARRSSEKEMVNQKIVVVLHEGEHKTKKYGDSTRNCIESIPRMEQFKIRISCLFHHIQKKGLQLQFNYNDLAGKDIDSESDLVKALESFIEEGQPKVLEGNISYCMQQIHFHLDPKHLKNYLMMNWKMMKPIEEERYPSGCT